MVAINSTKAAPLWMMEATHNDRFGIRKIAQDCIDPYTVYRTEENSLKEALLEKSINTKTNKYKLTEVEKMEMIDFETWCVEELSEFMIFDSFGLDNYDEWDSCDGGLYDPEM